LAKSLIASALLGPGEKRGHVLADRTLQEKPGEGSGAFGLAAHDDARGVQVVMQRHALAQEFRAEEDPVGPKVGPQPFGKADRDRRLDHDHGSGLGRQGIARDRLDARGIEIVGLRIVVGRGCDDDEIRTRVGVGCLGRGGQRKIARGEEPLKVGIDNGRLAGIDHVDPFARQVDGDHIVVLRQKRRIREADIPLPDDNNLQRSCLSKIPATTAQPRLMSSASRSKAAIPRSTGFPTSAQWRVKHRVPRQIMSPFAL